MATKTDVLFVQIVITVNTESNIVFEDCYTEEYIFLLYSCQLGYVHDMLIGHKTITMID